MSHPPLADSRVVSPAEAAIAANLISPMDFLRLKSIARLHARGLPPDVAWEDLLQEAMTRVLVGSRLQPPGVSMVAFLAGVMRSLKSEHWRRGRAEVEQRNVPIHDDHQKHSQELQLLDLTSDPERALIATEQIMAIEHLFSKDRIALRILDGLGQGWSAEQIRTHEKLTQTEYDTARRRIRRTLLREGLTCERK